MAAKPARGLGPLSDIGLGRIGAIAALVLTALTVQSTLLAQATLLGVIPQLVLVVVVALAYLDGERVGVVSGFAGGLLQDLLLPQSVIGLTALVYVMVAYAVGVLRQYSTSQAVWAPVIAVALATAAAEAGYAVLAIVLGQRWVGLAFTAKVVALVILYNTLLTPFVFPLVRRIADRFRPERVYRW
ncbi:MAG: rod shape-determining protein MreD [Chloroflexi bacterium]|nr:rod shape-determining protein MreD [Chloroflexota bacterium]